MGRNVFAVLQAHCLLAVSEQVSGCGAPFSIGVIHG